VRLGRPLSLLLTLAVAASAWSQQGDIGPVKSGPTDEAETANQMLYDLYWQASDRAGKTGEPGVFSSRPRDVLVMVDTSQIEGERMRVYVQGVVQRLLQTLHEDRKKAISLGPIYGTEQHRASLYFYDVAPQEQAAVGLKPLDPQSIASAQRAIADVRPSAPSGHLGRDSRNEVLTRLSKALPASQPFVVQIAYMGVDQPATGQGTLGATGDGTDSDRIARYLQRDCTVRAPEKGASLNAVYWLFGPPRIEGERVPNVRFPRAVIMEPSDPPSDFPWWLLALAGAAVAIFSWYRPRRVVIKSVSRSLRPLGKIDLARDAAESGGQPEVRFANGSDRADDLVGQLYRPAFGTVVVRPREPYRLVVDGTDTDQSPVERDQTYAFSRGEGPSTVTTRKVSIEIKK